MQKQVTICFCFRVNVLFLMLLFFFILRSERGREKKKVFPPFPFLPFFIINYYEYTELKYHFCCCCCKGVMAIFSDRFIRLTTSSRGWTCPPTSSGTPPVKWPSKRRPQESKLSISILHLGREDKSCFSNSPQKSQAILKYAKNCSF